MKLFLSLLTIFVAEASSASNLEIMKLDAGRNVYAPTGQYEKIQRIMGSNVDGSNLVTVLGNSTVCQIQVADLSEAMSIVSAASGNSVISCYTRDEIKRVDGKDYVLTKQVQVAKPSN